MIKRIFSIFLIFVVALLPMNVFGENSDAITLAIEDNFEYSGDFYFNDVLDKNAWYYNNVYKAVDSDLITGYDNGNFGPMDELTWIQTVVLASRIKQKIDNDFMLYCGNEVPWYSSYLHYALSNGIIENVPEDVNSIITRGEASIIFANIIPKEKTVLKEIEDNYFSDVLENHQAHEAIKKLASMGIVEGQSNNFFGVNNSFLRCEVATIIVRIIS